MRNFKPTTVILAFAAISCVSAKAITSTGSFMAAAPTAETELMTLRTMTPVIIDDSQITAALTGEHIETRKLILTAMSQDMVPSIPMMDKTARPDVRMSKPYVVADATPAPAAATPAASVVNESATEQTIAVDSGQTEKVYSIAPGASVTLDACTPGCTVTGPWGYSRDVKAGEVLTTTGKSEVTAVGKEKTVAKKAVAKAAAPAKKAAASLSAPAKTKKMVKASKAKQNAAAKSKPAKAKEGTYNPYFKGSFMSLFTGIVR